MSMYRKQVYGDEGKGKQVRYHKVITETKKNLRRTPPETKNIRKMR